MSGRTTEDPWPGSPSRSGPPRRPWAQPATNRLLAGGASSRCGRRPHPPRYSAEVTPSATINAATAPMRATTKPQPIWLICRPRSLMSLRRWPLFSSRSSERRPLISSLMVAVSSCACEVTSSRTERRSLSSDLASALSRSTASAGLPRALADHRGWRLSRPTAREAETSYRRFVSDRQGSTPSKAGAGATPGRASQRSSKDKAARQTP